MSGIALALSLCLRDSVPLTDSLKQADRKMPPEGEEEPLVQASCLICHETRQPACSEQVTDCTCIGGGHQWGLPELKGACCMAAGRGKHRFRGLSGERPCAIRWRAEHRGSTAQQQGLLAVLCQRCQGARHENIPVLADLPPRG